MYENIKFIRLSNMDDIQEFVSAASKCDFDIDVNYNRMFVDAKSILGVIGLGMQNNLKVCYGGNDENFQQVIDKFAVA